jgi:hypothetical protein
MRKNILFICGSLNQTVMMHKIAENLDEHNCVFTPFYADGILGILSKMGLLDFTILGGRHRSNTEQYLHQHGLPVHLGGGSIDFDLVVTCTDLIIQRNLRGRKIVLVQEGILMQEGQAYRLVRRFGLPHFLADTAATGLSHAYEVFCVASKGYRDLFIKKGISSDKIAVTGIPNFDHAASYLDNDFPYRNFALVATTCTRETFKLDKREQFIQEAKRIANGRKMIFKLHPNENFARARREIERMDPGALVYEDGNVHHMIANCDVLITQYSSVVFTGLALNKTVYSLFDLEVLRSLLPLQNGGISATNIADVCERVLYSSLPEMTSRQDRYRLRQGLSPSEPV